MSQRNVEMMIGRLATDEGFRRRFATSPEVVLAEVAAGGLELTPVERLALADLEMAACERFAARLDPRIQKIGPSRARPA